MSLQRNIATGYDFFNGLLVLVGDRGMISQKRIDDDLRNLEGVDLRWTPFSGPKWGVAKVEPAELNTSWS